MRIVVFGAGGVGGYFGGRLSESGQQVTFVARGKHGDAIRRDGLRVKSISGDFLVKPAHVTDSPSSVGTADLVIVGVKAWQVAGISSALMPMLGTATMVMPLQNGVEAASQLVEVLGEDCVVGGLCKIITAVDVPGCITHSGIDPSIAVGELDGSISNRIERLRDLFQQANVKVEVPPDIRISLWEKFLLIAPWGGLSALTRIPIGVLRDVPETRGLLERAMGEVQALASAHHIDLASDVVSTTLTFIDGLPPEGTASMQRDIAAGLPSELESMNGAVVRLGRLKGVDTPINTFVYHCLRPLELVARGVIRN